MIVLFDGRCLFCSRLARSLLARDKTRALRFASLDSPAARRLLAPHGVDASALETLAVIEGDRLLLRSEAVLAVVPALGFPYSLACALRLLPRPLRDAAYGLVARTRHRWSSRAESCFVPTDEERGRFIED